MGDDRIQELIQRDLDGDLSGAEKAELARLLLQDPGSRPLQDALRRADAALKAVPAATPPPGLRSSILEALKLSAGDGRLGNGAAGAAAGTGLLRYAAIAAAAALVVGLGYGLLDRGRGPQPGLEGSVAAPVLAGKVVAEARLPFDGGEVTARLLQIGDGSRLEIRSDATRDANIVTRFDPSLMNYLDGAGDARSSAPGELTVTTGTGRQSRVVDFDGIGPVTVQVQADGHVVGQASLDPAASN